MQALRTKMEWSHFNMHASVNKQNVWSTISKVLPRMILWKGLQLRLTMGYFPCIISSAFSIYLSERYIHGEMVLFLSFYNWYKALLLLQPIWKHMFNKARLQGDSGICLTRPDYKEIWKYYIFACVFRKKVWKESWL
jgi:hypothetical protein